MLLSSDPSPWLAVFGRFHIVLLHLPIGLIPGMFLLEFGAALFRRPLPKGAITTLAVLTALTAAAAFASGLALAEEKTQSDLLALHKKSAIAMAAVCVLLPILAPRRSRRPFRVALAAAMALSIPTGHFGGGLSHREGFLFKPLERAAQKPDVDVPADQNAANEDPPPAQPEADEPPAASTGYAAVAPILKRVCTSCHNDDDFEGDLDLTSRALVLEGWGADEPIVVPGKPEESVLMESLLLPLDDDVHMPPKDEEQITADEIAVVRAWIAAGCPE